jgi:hypothetical protein
LFSSVFNFAIFIMKKIILQRYVVKVTMLRLSA